MTDKKTRRASQLKNIQECTYKNSSRGCKMPSSDAEREIQARLCEAEGCDGRAHRCPTCGGARYIYHHHRFDCGIPCGYCGGKGRWPCPLHGIER